MSPLTLTLINDTRLVIDIPVPLYRLGETYQLTLLAGAMCSVLQPSPCLLSPWTYNLTMPADPVGGLQLTGMSVLGASPTNLTLLPVNGNASATQASAGWTTLAIPANATTVTLLFGAALPSNLTWLAWLVPADLPSLVASMLPPAASSPMGAVSLLGMPATRLIDRYLLHADMSNATVPARLLSACTVFNGSALQCALPVNATSALWRVVIDWVWPFPDGSWGIRRAMPLQPLFDATGAQLNTPLTLTFPMSTLTPGTAQRFAVAGGVHAIPSPFTVAGTVEDNGGTILALTNGQLTEPILVKGWFAPSAVAASTLRLFLGGPTTQTFGNESSGGQVLLPCTFPPGFATTSLLVCTTAPFTQAPAGAQPANLPLLLWDATSLVVAPSTDTYSYPSTPAVKALSGCGSAGPDSSGVLVQTTACLSAGGTIMRARGQFLFVPLKVSVGTFAATDVSVLDASSSTIQFTLPPGTGLALAVTVQSGPLTATLPNAVSYALPKVSGVAGCGAAVLGASVASCNRTGGDALTIFGDGFGPTFPSVLVASAKCVVNASSDTQIVCLLPAMPSNHPLNNQVIVVQASGGVTVAELTKASVSYLPCPAGQIEAGTACTDCPVGTFSGAPAPHCNW